MTDLFLKCPFVSLIFDCVSGPQKNSTLYSQTLSPSCSVYLKNPVSHDLYSTLNHSLIHVKPLVFSQREIRIHETRTHTSFISLSLFLVIFPYTLLRTSCVLRTLDPYQVQRWFVSPFWRFVHLVVHFSSLLITKS